MKYQKLEIRVTEKEKKHLTALSQESGLSVSEYVRIKLLEEQHLDKPSLYKKDMTTFVVLGYYLLGKMAKKQLSEEEIGEASERAKSFLKEHAME